MTHVAPMRLLRIPEPFDDPLFIFEPKLDGFRAVARVRGHRCDLVSRNGYTFKQWPQLAEEIAHAVRAQSCVLDGEICCLDADGRTNFKKLLFRREWPHFYAFDVLSIDLRISRHCLCSNASAGCLASCRPLRRGCCTSITSTSAAAICLAWRASETLKASSASGRTARTALTAA